MSVRFVRVIAILWVIAFVLTAAVGAACAAIIEWRSRVSSSEATQWNTVVYVEHGRTYYAPPDVAKWYGRSTSTFLLLAASIAVLSVFALVCARQSDAIGRRWWRR